ncbi:putative adhesin [Murinocardiopsis flavida]|uniref:Putative adhesin n=1 Tax=Murinocardiopsis flavida TaxID=645275 RepID=A0A2P8D6V0_9ACTN|nr:DUF4097 family beta strand repeat-containing protein [Murinocardiopsis flavida]PSK92954.1 putative adhesin [Murinocardiopsis flavida]
MDAKAGTAFGRGLRSAAPIALAALGVFALSGCGSAALGDATEKRADDSYGGITSLDLRNTDGETSVTGADVDEVRVERVHTYSDKAPSEKITDHGGTLRVDSGDCGEEWTFVGGRCTTDYTVTVPFGTKVTLRGDDGEITVADPRAAVDIKATDGDVTLSGAAGAVKLGAADGSLRLDGVTADSIAATTQDGSIDITAKDRLGSLAANAEDGDVTVTTGKEVGSLKAAAKDGDVSIATEGRAGSLAADTHDGDVSVAAGGAFGALAATTKDGDITVDTPVGGGPYAVKTDTGDGPVEVDVPRKKGADATIDASTSDGAITVRER